MLRQICQKLLGKLQRACKGIKEELQISYLQRHGKLGSIEKDKKSIRTIARSGK